MYELYVNVSAYVTEQCISWWYISLSLQYKVITT